MNQSDGRGDDEERWRARRRANASCRARASSEADAGPGEEGDDPAVVAGEDGGDERGGDEELWQAVAGLRLGSAVEGGAPFDQPDRDPDHFAEEERLGHGRGLEVEQIGIEGEEGERERGGRGRSQWRARR